MLTKKEFPLLEFDGVSNNIIEISKLVDKIDMSDRVVICFFNEVIGKLAKEGKLKEIYAIENQIGVNPVYELEYNGEKVTVVHPGVGAPLAVSIMEEVIAIGGRKFISCGSGGVLRKDIAVGHVIVPNAAVRDEGTSYHYVEASREIEVNDKAVKAIEKTLREHKCDYLLGKTWTTDSIFRETRDKAQLRKEEGCIAVEMECSALAALAQYRKVIFGQMIYGGDDISCDDWDPREEHDRTSVREKLFWFAVEAALNL